jgi:ketosteroid isomerase-like protein
MMDTRAVLEHHLAAMDAGDLEEVLKDYTEASVLLTVDGVFAGLEALRGFFQADLAGSDPSATFAVDVIRISGDVAFIVWHGSGATSEIPLGTDTFVVRDGKIVTQTVAARVEMK